MAGSPEEMAAYYADFPAPPTEPDPSDPNYAQAMEQFEADKSAFEDAKAAHEASFGPAPTPAPVSPPPAPGGGSGKPAARLGDMTAHGGSIVVGHPTTLIGNMPAARVGDMHACPMVTGIVPHVGGPILPPGSPTVLIGGMPAARVGDMATCVGPPDTIALGDFMTLIGP